MELPKKENENLKKNIESLTKDFKEINSLMGLLKKENENLKKNIESITKDYNEKKKNNKIEKPKDNNEKKENENKENQFNMLKKNSIPLQFKFVENIVKNEAIKEIVKIYPFNKIKETAQYLIIVEKESYKEVYIQNILVMIMENNDNEIIKEIISELFLLIYKIIIMKHLLLI